MKNIAIIPARSGSKGLKDKNIRLLNGKPLLAYSVEAALESEQFDEVMVSTDSEKYAEIAKEWGANVPFLRSAELSSDTATSKDVILDVLKRYAESGQVFDTFSLLQPTSPLRTAENICRVFQRHAKTINQTHINPFFKRIKVSFKVNLVNSHIQNDFLFLHPVHERNKVGVRQVIAINGKFSIRMQSI